MRKLEKMIKEELDNMIPNVIDDVKSQHVEKMSVEEYNQLLGIRQSKRNFAFSGILRLTTAVVVCLGMIVCGNWYYNSTKVSAVIDIDVNPSIEIAIIKNGTIKNVEAKNDDGAIILSDLDLKGRKLDEGIELLFEELISKDYVNSSRNAVLISVDCAKNDNNIELQKVVQASIETTLSKKQISGEYYYQNITDIHPQNMNVEDSQSEVEGNNVSKGKMLFINKIVGMGVEESIENLSSKSIEELANVVKEYHIDFDEVFDSYEVDDSLDGAIEEFEDAIEDILDDDEDDDKDDDKDDDNELIISEEGKKVLIETLNEVGIIISEEQLKDMSIEEIEDFAEEQLDSMKDILEEQEEKIEDNMDIVEELLEKHHEDKGDDDDHDDDDEHDGDDELNDDSDENDD